VWRILVGILAVLSVFVAPACSGGLRENDSSAAAQRFLSAVADGDFGAACDLLSTRTKDNLARSEGQGCEEVLGSQQLNGGAVRGSDVWGDRAQVRTDSGTLFLAEFAIGWKVVAAGCVPQGKRAR
jgi:hypothetical protein